MTAATLLRSLAHPPRAMSIAISLLLAAGALTFVLRAAFGSPAARADTRLADARPTVAFYYGTTPPIDVLAGYRAGWEDRPPRSPMRWRTVWRLTRLGRPPVL